MAWSWRRWLRRLFLEPLEDRTVPASISGYVYHDLNGNGLRDPGEPAIANNLIELRNSQGNLISTTTTNQNGFYQFTTDQSVNSSLQSQVQSFSFADANTNSIRQHSIQQFNPALGTLQSVEIRVDGRILSTIRLENLDNASAHVTGTVSGSLLLSGPGFNLNVQANGNAAIRQNLAAYDGTLDYAGSSGITLVNRSATGSQTQTIQGSNLSNFIGSGTVSFSFLAQATTEATGGGNLMANITNLGGADVTVTYKYLNNNSLKPGQYTIIQKNQPTGFLDGRESQGGAVVPNSINTDKLFVQLGTAASVENNFGEYSPARVSGFVYHDANNNGLKEATERFFSNIPVTLTGINDIGQSIQIAGRTDNNGHYNFGNLRPGQYTVTQNSQPSGFTAGKLTPGSAGGTVGSTRAFSNIPLSAGTQATDYNFGQLAPMPPSGGSGVGKGNLLIPVNPQPVVQPPLPIIVPPPLPTAVGKGNLLTSTGSTSQIPSANPPVPASSVVLLPPASNAPAAAASSAGKGNLLSSTTNTPQPPASVAPQPPTVPSSVGKGNLLTPSAGTIQPPASTAPQQPAAPQPPASPAGVGKGSLLVNQPPMPPLPLTPARPGSVGKSSLLVRR